MSTPKTPTPPDTWRYLMAFIIVGSVLDAVFTLHLVDTGIVYEANPIMAPLLAYPWLFLLVKLGATVGGVAAILYVAKRDHSRAMWVLHAATILYLGILCWHVYITVQAVDHPMPPRCHKSSPTWTDYAIHPGCR